ncbi:hypothetical protein [Polluticoccus soli]|uniref:hypothetical protein n=1 Tax=Polluticoccus soli TaxID=3034150 RepID=UPI0023E0F2E5|nr:hypothetical protein [Flavipsychrobacter sp. JY13-12]
MSTTTGTTIGAPVSIEEANQYITNHIDGYFNPGHYPVKSFSYDAGLLRDYLNANPNIENVKIVLGVRPDEGGTNAPTLVLVGYDVHGNYIKTADNMVLDQAISCPHACPTVGPASQDLIS